jgi:hypothetical protein
MLIGQGVNKLEQRITNALCGGSLHLKELKFLQDISRKIGFYQERAHLSDRQAGFLFTILTRAENGNACRPSKTQIPNPSTRNVAREHSLPEDASEFSRLARVLAGHDNINWED